MNIPIEKYKERKTKLEEQFLPAIEKIKNFKIDSEKPKERKMQEYFGELARINNLQVLLGWPQETDVFDSLINVIKCNSETIFFIRNRSFEKTYYYLRKIKETLDKYYKEKTKEVEKIETLLKSFSKYSHNTMLQTHKYNYIRNSKDAKLSELYQTTIDTDLFTALYEYSVAKSLYIRNDLRERIKLEIGANISKNDFIPTNIQDHANFFWALYILLVDNTSEKYIEDKIENIDKFTEVVIQNLEDQLSYPQEKDLKYECTTELIGEYKTKLYVLQNIIAIYEHFLKREDIAKHKDFLKKIREFIISFGEFTILGEKAKEKSDNVYFLCMQLEVTNKILNMESSNSLFSDDKKINSRIKKSRDKKNNLSINTEYDVWTDEGKEVFTQDDIDNYKKESFFMDDETNQVFLKGDLVKCFKGEYRCKLLKRFLKHRGIGGRRRQIFNDIYYPARWPENGHKILSKDKKNKGKLNQLLTRFEKDLEGLGLGEIEKDGTICFKENFKFCLAKEKEDNPDISKI